MKKAVVALFVLVSAIQAMGQSTSKPAEKNEPCSLCRGIGTIPCQDCKGSNGLPTGKKRCDTCAGSGKSTCSACSGKWKVACARCNGTGKVQIGSSGGLIQHPVYGTCSRFAGGCGGDGYTFLCRKCNEGKVNCVGCQAKGWLGDCAKCNGDKKVPCPRCQGEKPAAPAPSPSGVPAPGVPAPAAPASETAAPKNVAPADPLSSLDDLVAHLKKAQPANPQADQKKWGEMTTLQQDEALRKFREEIATWKSGTQFQGRKVVWKVLMEDAASAADGGFLVKASSPGGCFMNWPAPASAKDQLLKLKKKDSIMVSGTIKDYRFTESAPGKMFNTGLGGFEINLTDAAILPELGQPTKLGASSKPG